MEVAELAAGRADQRTGVAVFVDLENIRYNMNGENRVEPKLGEIMEKAKEFGPVLVSRAYGDFSRHPDWVRKELDIAGILVRDLPHKVLRNADGTKFKSTVDSNMMLDIVETALDHSQIETFLLFTGDSDFTRIITILKNRFEKRVGVVGIAGSMSQILINAADFSDTLSGDIPGTNNHLEESANVTPISSGLAKPIEVESNGNGSKFVGLKDIVESLVLMIAKKTPRCGFWTIRAIERWAVNDMNGIPGTYIQKDQAISYMVGQQFLVSKQHEAFGEQQTPVRISYLNSESPEVQEILQKHSLTLNEDLLTLVS